MKFLILCLSVLLSTSSFAASGTALSTAVKKGSKFLKTPQAKGLYREMTGRDLPGGKQGERAFIKAVEGTPKGFQDTVIKAFERIGLSKESPEVLESTLGREFARLRTKYSEVRSQRGHTEASNERAGISKNETLYQANEVKPEKVKKTAKNKASDRKSYKKAQKALKSSSRVMSALRLANRSFYKRTGKALVSGKGIDDCFKHGMLGERAIKLVSEVVQAAKSAKNSKLACLKMAKRFSKLAGHSLAQAKQRLKALSGITATRNKAYNCQIFNAAVTRACP